MILAPLFILTQLLLAQPAETEYIRYSAPEMFSYEELVSLSEDKPIEPAIAEKLQAMRTTPFLSNEAYYQGTRPRTPKVEGLGEVMRVVVWNAERGVHSERLRGGYC